MAAVTGAGYVALGASIGNLFTDSTALAGALRSASQAAGEGCMGLHWRHIHVCWSVHCRTVKLCIAAIVFRKSQQNDRRTGNEMSNLIRLR